jgi:acyl-CoA thioester hydrolase
MDSYSRTYEIRWSDLDANGHVNYASYIDATGDLRYRFFIAHNFPPEKFSELGIGPIYTTIHADFFREVLMGETVVINYTLSGLSPSGGRWRAHHDILREQSRSIWKEQSLIWPLASLPFPALNCCRYST